MEREVAAVPEEVVRLRVNQQLVATWSCTPDALEALAAGRLLAMGFLTRPEDLLGLRVERGAPHTVLARVPEERMAAAVEEREHREWHGCGLRYLVDCAPGRLTGPAGRTPDPAAFRELFRELFDRSPTRRTTGGHHTTALSDGASLLHLNDEVGRHNGADKAIGAALLEGPAVRGLGLITSARISGEIAEKAARAGLAWIASRSVPTTLAVDIAAAAGIPIVARAASAEARVLGGGAEDVAGPGEGDTVGNDRDGTGTGDGG